MVRCALLGAALLSVSTPSTGQPSNADPALPTTPSPAPVVLPFPEWLQGLREEALARGISPSTVAAALSDVAPVTQILERDRTQAEFKETLSQYLSRRVGAPAVRLGRSTHRKHANVLGRVEAAYGVPTQVLVAVWGLESSFGRFSGVRPLVPTLATLAYDQRRGAMFRAQLFDALAILDAGHIDLPRLKGSWAGAMGQPQFMPSSYLAYAVDFDGDGRRNIWTSSPDVFASIANYLSKNGWVTGQRWGRPVKLPGRIAELERSVPLRTEGCRAAKELTEPRPLAEWQALGVRTHDGHALPRADMDASLLRTDAGAFLVYRNYEAILSYNCANAYALAVARLADRIEDSTPSPSASPAKKAPRKATRKAAKTPVRK